MNKKIVKRERYTNKSAPLPTPRKLAILSVCSIPITLKIPNIDPESKNNLEKTDENGRIKPYKNNTENRITKNVLIILFL